MASFSPDLIDLQPVLEHQFLSCLLLILFLLNYCYCCDRAQSILLQTLWALVKKIEDFPFLIKFRITPSEDRNCVRKTKAIARNNSTIVKWLCFPSERWSKMWKCHQVSWERHFLKLQPDLHFSQQKRQNGMYSDSLYREKWRSVTYLLVWGKILELQFCDWIKLFPVLILLQALSEKWLNVCSLVLVAIFISGDFNHN